MLKYTILLACIVSLTLARPFEGDVRISFEPMTYSEEANDYEEELAYGMGFLARLQEAINMMHDQMYDTRPAIGGTFNLTGLPPNYSNSTYTEQDIDGTLVRVNQTIHTFNNSDSNIVVFHKTISLVPKDELEGKIPDSEMVPTSTEKVPLPSEVEKVPQVPTTTSESPVVTTARPLLAEPIKSEVPELMTTASPSPVISQETTAVPAVSQEISSSAVPDVMTTMSNEVRPSA